MIDWPAPPPPKQRAPLSVVAFGVGVGLIVLAIVMAGAALLWKEPKAAPTPATTTLSTAAPLVDTDSLDRDAEFAWASVTDELRQILCDGYSDFPVLAEAIFVQQVTEAGEENADLIWDSLVKIMEREC